MALGLAAVALVSALIVVAVARDRGGGAGGVSSVESSDVEAQGSLSPRITLFGDTISARVDVTLDRMLYDVASVRVIPVLSLIHI